MSSELNIESVNTILPPLPPQQKEVLSIINPDKITNSNLLEGLEPPVLRRQQANDYQSEELFVKGKFLYIQDKHSREMLINAWNAITEVDLWDYMRNDCYSYMCSNDEQISIISNKMEELGYNGHSGFSFGWTMRQMQYIAKHGEEKYAEEIIVSNIKKEFSKYGVMID